MDAVDTGGNRCREERERPANSGRMPRRNASSNVDRAGLKRAAWANATRSDVEAFPMAALAWACCWMSSSHSFEAGVREPWRMMLSLCRMVTVDAVKATSQPASHSCPMERRGCVARSGRTWPWRAEGGRPGMARSASWVECKTAPEGVCTAIGVLVVRLLHTGVEGEKKCEVHPESAMA